MSEESWKVKSSQQQDFLLGSLWWPFLIRGEWIDLADFWHEGVIEVYFMVIEIGGRCAN